MISELIELNQVRIEMTERCFFIFIALVLYWLTHPYRNALYLVVHKNGDRYYVAQICILFTALNFVDSDNGTSSSESKTSWTFVCGPILKENYILGLGLVLTFRPKIRLTPTYFSPLRKATCRLWAQMLRVSWLTWDPIILVLPHFFISCLSPCVSPTFNTTKWCL